MGATDIPQRLPVRATRLETSDPDAMGAVQPERRRSYHQIAPGGFRGSVSEHAFGSAALGRERWSCGMRVRCERPTGYTVFAVPLAVVGSASFCGRPLAPGALLRIDGPWELSSTGPFEFVAFAVDDAALATAAAQLAGEEPPARPHGSAALWHPAADRLGDRLVTLLDRLASAAPAGAPAAASAQLLHIAAALERAEGPRPERLAPPSQRRAAVRRIEEYLDASPGAAPPVPILCGIAGVSERTLEYAFRDQLGMTLVRYLKLRRLNLVRRALQGADPASASVTRIALQLGFHDLGRFAGEYRALFRELPSQTLRGDLRIRRTEAPASKVS